MYIEHIYIIHHPDLAERKAYIDKKIPLLQIPYTFCKKYTSCSFELHDKKYFDTSEINFNKKNSVMLKYDRPLLLREWESFEQELRGRAISLEHFKVYEHVLENTFYDNILVLEDDVMFKPGFKDALLTYCNHLPPDYDICYIGSGKNYDFELTPLSGNNIIEKHPKLYSRCSDSYIVSRKALKKIISTILPFCGTIDEDLNYAQMVNNLNVYWVTNPLIYQGSQENIYTSSFCLY